MLWCESALDPIDSQAVCIDFVRDSDHIEAAIMLPKFGM